MAQEHAPTLVGEGRIERDPEPRGQPVQGVRGGAVDVEQHLRGCDAILDSGVRPFHVGQEPVHERGRLGVLAIGPGQVMLGVGETREVRAQSVELRALAAVTRQHQSQLGEATAQPLEQQLPGAALRFAGLGSSSMAPNLFTAPPALGPSDPNVAAASRRSNSSLWSSASINRGRASPTYSS